MRRIHGRDRTLRNPDPLECRRVGGCDRWRVFALVLAAIISRTGTGTALLIGTGFGLALYVVNFYGMTAVFPWFSNARNWVSIFAHAVFGLVAAAAYVRLAARTPVRTQAG